MTDPAMPTGRHAVLAALTGIGVALVVLFAATADRGLPPDPPPNASALWHRDYQSFAEMLDSPGAAAVVGTVISVNPSYSHEGVVLTQAVVEVERVLAGSDRVPPGRLTVVQTGGSVPGGRTEHLKDVRLLALQDRVLLFLIPEPVSGVWGITGGPYGHFMIDGDEVRSATLEEMFDGEPHPLVVAVRDRTLEDVVREVESLEAAQ